MTQNEIQKLYIVLYSKINNALEKYSLSKLTKRKKLVNLNKDITNIVNEGYKNLYNDVKKSLSKVANRNYLLTLYKSEKKAKINITKNIINKVDNLVKNIVNKKIAGKTLEQRLIKNNRKLIKDSLRIIKIELKKNSDINVIAKQLQLKLNIDKNRAIKIARTETHRISEESTYRAYEEARREGINFRIRWLATLDIKRTRDTHLVLDGKYADKEGYFYSSGGKTKYPGGFGIAKEDINCRCTTIQVFDELQGTDIRYVQDTGEYINYKTFDEWRRK